MSTAPPGSDATTPDAEASEGHACTYCNRPTVADRGRMTLWIDGRLVVIEHVPARVCTACGETFYQEGITARVDRLQSGPGDRPEPIRTISAPVFAWDDL